MASYTMTLRECLQTLLTFKGVKYSHLNTRDFIEEGRKVLFDFDYQIFDTKYKKVFETKFIRNFYMREIGFEVEDLFKFQLETWLLIHMPYFNNMYESELIKYDPLTNAKMEVKHTKKNDKSQNDVKTASGEAISEGNNTSLNSQTSTGEIAEDKFNRELNSDNPDSRLALTSNKGEGVIEYASKISEDSELNKRNSTGQTSGETNDTSNSTSNVNQNEQINSEINEVEDFIQSRFGKIGVQSYSKMIMEYRQSLIRIDKTIFEEMQQLFMLVY